MPVLTNCVALLNVYQNCPEVVVLVLELYVDVVDSQIAFLDEVSCRRCLFKVTFHCDYALTSLRRSRTYMYDLCCLGDRALLNVFSFVFQIFFRMKYQDFMKSVWHLFKRTASAT